MTTTAIIITTLCLILAAGYAIWLHFAAKPQLTAEESAELGTEKEWWKVD